MKENNTYDKNWKEIYESGKMLNKYPFDALVTFTFRKFGKIKDKSKIKVLDIGCGAGNNSWFFAKEGFDITGIDISKHAIEYAKKRFEEEDLKGKFYQKSFFEIKDLKENYNLIVDRGSLCTQEFNDIETILLNINNKLSNNGYFISFFYNKEIPQIKHYKTVDGITFFAKNNKNAPMGKRVTLLNDISVDRLFNKFDYELYKHQNIPIKVSEDILTGISEFIIICKKKQNE